MACALTVSYPSTQGARGDMEMLAKDLQVGDCKDQKKRMRVLCRRLVRMPCVLYCPLPAHSPVCGFPTHVLEGFYLAQVPRFHVPGRASTPWHTVRDVSISRMSIYYTEDPLAVSVLRSPQRCKT